MKNVYVISINDTDESTNELSMLSEVKLNEMSNYIIPLDKLPSLINQDAIDTENNWLILK